MIVVTTPTGTIGSRLAELLIERGEAVRVVARDPSRLAPAVRDGAETIAGSHADPAVLDAALAGADALFLLVPPDGRTDSVEGHYLGYAREARAAIERHGVGHAVMISTMGEGDGAGLLSAARAAEAELGRSGAAVRALAPPFFMENLLRQADAIREGVVAFPSAADRVLPLVATDDLATRAADLLADRSWDAVDRIPISSPDALTPTEIAAVLGESIGREVTYRELPTTDYAEMLRTFGMSPASVEGMVAMAVAQNAGFYDSEFEAARATAPTTLAEWCARKLVPALAR
jgi:uncharacterized protein YbjT (DUF2867 family)